MSISPLGRAAMTRNADNAQRDKEDIERKKEINELVKKIITPFERASNLGNICEWPQILDDKGAK
jgi:hypothetical protein